MGESAVLCVMCGFDTRLGHRLKTRVGSAVVVDEEELGELPTHGNSLLDAAERQLARDKLEQARLSKGAPWWILLLAFLGLVGFAIAMVSMPQERVMDNSGIVLQVAGGLMFLLYFFRMLIIAFKESVLQGVLALVMPPYYAITRWDRVAGVCILMFVGVSITMVGYVLIVLAPIVNKLKGDEKKASQIRFERGPAIVMVCHDTTMIQLHAGCRAPRSITPVVCSRCRSV
jgi:hypothetical protein